jgi:hypothetical protein
MYLLNKMIHIEIYTYIIFDMYRDLMKNSFNLFHTETTRDTTTTYEV